MAIDEQDGKIEDASTTVKLRGKETQDSTQPKLQATVTDAQPENKVLQDVNVVRGANPGANIKTGRVTIVSLVDTGWVPLPATPLPGRVALAIQNYSGRDMEVKYQNAGAYGTGILILDGDERSYDIPAGVVVYGRLESGGPRNIRVEELAEE